MDILAEILRESWHILEDSSVYVIFGLLIAGLLKVFVSPGVISRHLGRGRFASVFKAALLGVPLPLCCCGVLPAAAALKREGANNGATTAFLISTPESGVDSIAVTYALMDPIMTVARPVAAFVTAAATGLAQNLVEEPPRQPALAGTPPALCAGGGCCCGADCVDPAASATPAVPPGLGGKLRAGLTYAGGELWEELAPWFLGGLLLTGAISVLTPEDFFANHLGGGLSSMLIMLVVGIPIYICASASTPIVAALMLKGLSPGAALVFLLAGPATNMTALTVLWKLMGKKATLIYLAGIAVCSVLAGLALDQVYAGLGVAPRAVIGQAAELVPEWARLAGALLLLALSAPPLWRRLRQGRECGCDHCQDPAGAAHLHD